MADAQTFEAPKPARPGEGHDAGLHLPEHPRDPQDPEEAALDHRACLDTTITQFWP